MLWDADDVDVVYVAEHPAARQVLRHTVTGEERILAAGVGKLVLAKALLGGRPR